MKEKERFENRDGIYDTIIDDYADTDILVNLLNQQDKRIKELEQESYPAYKREHKRRAYLENIEVPRLEKENEQLKQELYELPKKIADYFYDEIRHRAILEDDYCPDHNLERKYGVRKCLLEDIRDTILKKFGGEENGNSNM